MIQTGGDSSVLGLPSIFASTYFFVLISAVSNASVISMV